MKKRCHWATNEWCIPHHDEEWGVPVHDDRLQFEFLVLGGAQAGLSWNTVLKKRARYGEVLATGMVNDHVGGCFRYRQLGPLTQRQV